MFHRELTEEENKQLQQAVSDYVEASMKKRDFMDELMMKTTLVKPGDLLYFTNADQSMFGVLGVVTALERPYAKKQMYLMDNNVRCHYKYVASKSSPWLAPKPTDSKVFNVGVSVCYTDEITHPTCYHRKQMVELYGEPRVTNVDKLWLESNPWADEVVRNLLNARESN